MRSRLTAAEVVRQFRYSMTAQDLERIARKALRDLGAGEVTLTLTNVSGSDRWDIAISGIRPRVLRIRAGEGTTAQFVREQIFEQFERR